MEEISEELIWRVNGLHLVLDHLKLFNANVLWTAFY